MTSIDVPESMTPGVPVDRDGDGRPGSLSLDLRLPSTLSTADWLWNMRDPVLAWVISTTRPRVVVELGASGGQSFFAICEAVERLGVDARCLAVGSFAGVGAGPDGEPEFPAAGVAVEGGFRFGPWAEFAELAEGPAMAPEHIELLHVQLSDPALAGGGHAGPWLDRLSPGAVVLVSGGAQRRERWEVWQAVGERCTLVALDEVGLALGQVPSGGDAPLVEKLSVEPEARAQLALLAERGAYRYALGSEPCSPDDLRGVVGRIETERLTELDTCRRGLAAVRRELDGVLSEEGRLAEKLAAERDLALAAQQDELDALAAKVAISAARYERKLTELALAEADRRSDLESRLAAAWQEIDSLTSSTSWRLTAALRLLSSHLRRLAKR